ncbi:hypothetical protein Barb4_01824 [Bacteroidales bacterium Barb4]|nr:hypothetical protein Barb4_01824 [Bacteroidales bacterium Barb4]
MPEQTVITFCRKGFRFGLNMLFPGIMPFIRFPIIACYPVHIMMFLFCSKFFRLFYRFCPR